MTRLDDDKAGAEILVMKGYGVKESWTSLYIIRDLEINSSYGIMTQKVIVYNPKNDNRRDILDVGIGRKFTYGPMITYVESLTSPKEYYWSEKLHKMFGKRRYNFI